MIESNQLQAIIKGYPYRVLIVDDDAVQRALEQEILQPPKYAVTEAASGIEALQLLSNQAFDVVLLDKRMPGMDGDEVCRRIRSELELELLPIIMVTGIGSSGDLSCSLTARASDFISKPYYPEELIARLDSAVKHKRLTDQLDSAESMLFALARMVEAKDKNTGDHCSRLAHISVVLGRALGLEPEYLIALRRGGVLHDIGKLGIPDRILLKPDKLTDDEWKVMRQHPEIGARLVKDLKSMHLTLSIIRHHHERWDGGGYPDGLKGKDIPLLARVFQIADIYDALSNQRPYKSALSREQVIEIMEEEAGKGWRDPELTRKFLDIVRQRPHDLELQHNVDDDLGSDLFASIVNPGELNWAVG
ncbi:HD-GYP domain-containing protein [Candidatus Methylobacter oryzae]|uniref:Response regulator n=1 Tax=Candidatus Methylobacter oryzae TaxID=2497749 RepID=A0ABY3CG71_9GAMM|nr:HD domain-containing phosphohydrolase [Candidatus Methylobacter oryzae]TRX02637.1 response regulator [Candidatus Methylobacter oryzae]